MARAAMKLELGATFVLILGACNTGEITGGGRFDDLEAGVVVLEGEPLATELATSPEHRALEPFVRLGVVWEADRPDAFELSTSVDGATWSPWSLPTVSLEESGTFVGQATVAGEPAQLLRLRGVAGATPTFVRVELLTFDELPAPGLADPPSGAPVVIASLAGVEVHPRSDWRARSARCSSSIGTVNTITIHHTETPTSDSLSPEARLRQIQSYHMDVKGWCDIGYHYLISRDGRVWQGRPNTVIGAHTASHNTGNVGIAVIGTYASTSLTDAQRSSLSALVRAVARDKGLAIDRTHVKAHRDFNDTTCPGTALYNQMSAIIAGAAGGGDPPDPPDDPPTGGTCDLPTDGAWTCGGLTGRTTNPNHSYYTTSFGCWVDSSGNSHSDSGDNCIPACSLSSIGCSGLSGPTCERRLNWYTADADRFGCGTKLKVTNPDTGDSAVLIVIDRGPSCSVENNVDHWVLDMSTRASYYFFGGPTGAGEHADVVVEVVPSSTPLGPTSAAGACEF